MSCCITHSILFIMTQSSGFKWPSDIIQTDPLSCWPQPVVPHILWWSLRWQIRCAQVTLDPLCAFLSFSAQEKLAPMEFSFVAYCAKSMCPLLFPRQGAWISTFFCLCVCISFRYLVFTNLSPLPALPKTTTSPGIASSLCQPPHWFFFMCNNILSSSSVPTLSSLLVLVLNVPHVLCAWAGLFQCCGQSGSTAAEGIQSNSKPVEETGAGAEFSDKSLTKG